MTDTIDIKEFERCAEHTGTFKGVELDLLRETILSWRDSPGTPYTVLELRDGRTLAAFAILCAISGREATYDIRYFVLDRDYRSTAGGAKMLDLISESILARHPFAVVRFETSSRKIAHVGADVFETAGYKVIGHIPGYYAEDDDYFYLITTVYSNPPKKEKQHQDKTPAGAPPSEGESAPSGAA